MRALDVAEKDSSMMSSSSAVNPGSSPDVAVKKLCLATECSLELVPLTTERRSGFEGVGRASSYPRTSRQHALSDRASHSVAIFPATQGVHDLHALQSAVLCRSVGAGLPCFVKSVDDATAGNYAATEFLSHGGWVFVPSIIANALSIVARCSCGWFRRFARWPCRAQ